MDKMINTGRYPVKLGNGTLLSVKEGNVIREGTRGAVGGKKKGNERKEPTTYPQCSTKRDERELQKTRRPCG